MNHPGHRRAARCDRDGCRLLEDEGGEHHRREDGRCMGNQETGHCKSPTSYRSTMRSISMFDMSSRVYCQSIISKNDTTLTACRRWRRWEFGFERRRRLVSRAPRDRTRRPRLSLDSTSGYAMPACDHDDPQRENSRPVVESSFTAQSRFAGMRPGFRCYRRSVSLFRGSFSLLPNNSENRI